MSISKDGPPRLHLKSQANSCFVDNYFDVSLKALQANMDTQPVLNEYNAVIYMCQYFSETEDQYSQAMKQQSRKPLRTECIIVIP